MWKAAVVGPAQFSARLDEDTDDRFSRLVRAAGENLGKLPSYRGRREPERVDLLRALLMLAERDEAVRAAMFTEIGRDRQERYSPREETS